MTAPDEVLETFLALTRVELTAALAVSPEACIRFLDARLNIRATLPAAVVKQDDEVTRMLFDSSPRKGPPLTEAEAGIGLRPVVQTLTQHQLDLVSSPKDHPDEPKAVCEAHISFYDAIDRLPNRRGRVLALRALFQSRS